MNYQPMMQQPGMMPQQPMMQQPGMMPQQPMMQQPGMMPQQPMMQQPGMMPQQGMIQQPGMMPGMMPQQGMRPDPQYKRIKIGAGIDMNEYKVILNAAKYAYTTNQPSAATVIANMIKSSLRGNWFVFVSKEEETKDYNFALTCVTGGDFLAFCLDSTLFQICRLSN